MNPRQLSAARAIWRARRERTGGDKVYALYAFLLVAVIIIVPIVRALWFIVSSPNGLAVLMTAGASAAVSMIVAVLWIGGLLLGRKRGPTLLPPFLLHGLTNSGIPRSFTLRRSLLRSAGIIVAACTAGSTLVGTALFSDSQTQLWSVILFVAATIATGVVTTVVWLIGQVFPRVVFPIALSVLLLAGMSFFMPQVLAFTPWGWAGATYPLSTGSGALPLAGTAVLAAASIIMTPVLLDRLTGMQLSKQAAQWERAAAFSFSFDFRATTAVYEAEPQIGRSICAITLSRHRWITFFARDIVGQVRTPGRSLGAIVATAIAGVLMTLSFLPDRPSALLAATAGIVIYGTTGSFAKGLQHATSVAGDYPLYGISDRHLVLLHALFPLIALLAILTVTATVTASVSGTSLGIALTGAGAVGVLALALRLGSALKGPLPPSLLTPVNTPAGDLSIVMRAIWAFNEPLIVIFGALTVTMLPITPIPLALLAAWTTIFILVRWEKRR